MAVPFVCIDLMAGVTFVAESTGVAATMVIDAGALVML
jgi:hypothetical protein